MDKRALKSCAGANKAADRKALIQAALSDCVEFPKLGPLDGAPAVTVSVVIRTFNRRGSIVRAIESARAQTNVSLEVIVVDDASTDGTAEIVHDRFQDDPAVRLLRREENMGSAAAANTGVAAALGQYVAFLDSDDSYLPDALVTHLMVLRATPGAILSYSDYIQVWEPFGIERSAQCGPAANAREMMLVHGNIIHSMSTVMVLRDAVLDAGGFDTGPVVGEDCDLWLRLALEADDPFARIPIPLVRYQISDDGLTTREDRWYQDTDRIYRAAHRHPAGEPFAASHGAVMRKLGLAILVRGHNRKLVRDGLEHRFRVAVPLPPEPDNETIAGLLGSLMNQTYRNFDVVLVGAAPRPVRDVLRGVLGPDRVEAVTVERPVTTGIALNMAAAGGDADLLAVLEPGMEWAPEYLDIQRRAHSFVGNRTACGWSVPDTARRDLDRPPPTPWRRDAVAFAATEGALPRHATGLVVDAEVFRGVGGADPTLEGLAAADLALRIVALLENEIHSDWRRQHRLPVRISRPLYTAPGRTGGGAGDDQVYTEAETIVDQLLKTNRGDGLRWRRGAMIEGLVRFARGDGQ